MSTWANVRTAIMHALVLGSDLPASHFCWADGPQNFTFDPRFRLTISASRSVHDRRVYPANPATDPISLSTMTEFTVGVRCESLRNTLPGVERRMLALDALEYVRMSSWRNDVWDYLRAQQIAWYDDAGIIQLSAKLDDRVVASYHCDLMMRAVIDQIPRVPNIGTIEHVDFSGELADPPLPDVEIAGEEP